MRLVLLFIVCSTLLTVSPTLYADDGCGLGETDCRILDDARLAALKANVVNIVDFNLLLNVNGNVFDIQARGPIEFEDDYISTDLQIVQQTSEPRIYSNSRILLHRNIVYYFYNDRLRVYQDPYVHQQLSAARDLVANLADGIGWETGDNVNFQGQNLLGFTRTVEFGDWIAPEMIDLAVPNFSAITDLNSETTKTTLNVIYRFLEEEPLSVTIHIGEDDHLLYLVRVEIEQPLVSATLDITLDDYNNESLLQPPDILKPVQSLDATLFADYAGIPFAGEGIRDITRADDLYPGVVRGMTEDGIAFIGGPQAPIVFAYLGDFTCFTCIQYSFLMDELVHDYVRTGDLRIEYYPYPVVVPERATVAASAAVCAGEQGAFWEFRSRLVALHLAEGIASFTRGRMVDLSDELGLDGVQLLECINGDLPEQAIATAQSVRAGIEVPGIPTIVYRHHGEETWHNFIQDGVPLAFLWQDDIRAWLDQNAHR